MGSNLLDPIKRELTQTGVKISIIFGVVIFVAMIAALTVYAKVIK